MVRVGSGSQLKEVLVKLVLVAVKVSDVSVPLPVSSHHHLSAALELRRWLALSVNFSRMLDHLVFGEV